MMLAVVLCFALCACGGSDVAKSCDEQFLEDFRDGLIARWDLCDDGEEHSDGEIVNCELKYLSKYADATFEDEMLGRICETYLEVLEQPMEDAYYTRCAVIAQLVRDYGVEFPEEYSDTTVEMIADGNYVLDLAELENGAQEIVDSIEFVEVPEEGYSGSHKHYEAIVENTTDKTIDLFVNINLIDADGILVDDTITSAQNFKPGQKAKLEFGTSVEFAELDYSFDVYEVD